MGAGFEGVGLACGPSLGMPRLTFNVEGEREKMLFFCICRHAAVRKSEECDRERDREIRRDSGDTSKGIPFSASIAVKFCVAV